MKRRSFLVAVAVLAVPRLARAQPAGKVHRIALLDDFEKAAYPAKWQSFRLRLRELGYFEGKNVAFDARWADSAPERMPRLAKEAVDARPHIIVCNGTPDLCAVVTAAFPSRRQLCRQNPEGRKAGRAADRAADEVRPRNQRQDRQSAWRDDSAVDTSACRASDRVALYAARRKPTSSFAFTQRPTR